LNGQPYLIEDEMASKYYSLWQNKTVDGLVKEILGDITFWGFDLSRLPGFQQSVANNLNSIISDGMKATLEKVHPKKIYA